MSRWDIFRSCDVRIRSRVVWGFDNVRGIYRSG